MKKIVITNENVGMRLDKFLAKEFFSMSRGEITRQLKNGKVLVNGKVEKPSYIIEEDDGLEIGLIEKEKALIANDEIYVEILYEDNNLMVINKPAGLQVHPGHLNEKDTLVNWLVAKYPDIVEVHDESEGAWMRPGIVHRLDRDTSGVMVIALSQGSFIELKRVFHDREVEKTYLALVQGIFEKKSGVINKPLARSTTYKKQVIARKNTKTIVREAVTEYQVLGENGEISLIEAKPKTGRMHQIRIHLTSIGHSIIGDVLYGDKKACNEAAKRQMLHAFRLKFAYKGKKYEFLATIPKDMLEIGKSIDGLAKMNYAEKAL